MSNRDADTKRRPLGRRIAAVVFVLFLACQLVVPLFQLPKQRPARFGWQMFSGLGSIPRYWLVQPDGQLQEVNIHDHIGIQRLDADYHSVLPKYLCRKHPWAVAVRWQWPDSPEIEELRCAP